MSNKNYIRGYGFENERVNYHLKNGALDARRSAGSHSQVDVWALYPGYTVMEQLKRCKKLNRDGGIPASIKKDLFKFMEYAEKFNGSETKLCFYLRVDGKKEPLLLFST